MGTRFRQFVRPATFVALWLLMAVVVGCGRYVPQPPSGANATASSGGSMGIFGILLAIFVVCVAFLYTEQLWSNILRLVNVVTAALLAMNYYEPVTRMLMERAPSYTVMWDFLAIWGVFAVVFIVLRALTDLVSRVDVRFLKVVDRSGSLLVAAWIGWIMVCFTTATLHTAPLARNFLYGGFQPGSSMFWLFSPDDQWLGFTQRMARGSLCHSRTTPFDPNNLFYKNYTERRTEFEAYFSRTGRLRINPDALAQQQLAPAPVRRPPPPQVRPGPKPAPKQVPKDAGIQK